MTELSVWLLIAGGVVAGLCALRALGDDYDVRWVEAIVMLIGLLVLAAVSGLMIVVMGRLA